MPDYQPGHVKHRVDTLELAIRTSFPETDERLALMAWIVAGPRSGVRHATTAQVDDWDDLFIPGAGS